MQVNVVISLRMNLIILLNSFLNDVLSAFIVLFITALLLSIVNNLRIEVISSFDNDAYKNFENNIPVATIVKHEPTPKTQIRSAIAIQFEIRKSTYSTLYHSTLLRLYAKSLKLRSKEKNRS